MADSKAGDLRITLVRSVIGQRPAVRAAVRSLALRRIRSSVVRADTPSVRGMIKTASHLLKVDVIGEEKR